MLRNEEESGASSSWVLGAQPSFSKASAAVQSGGGLHLREPPVVVQAQPLFLKVAFHLLHGPSLARLRAVSAVVETRQPTASSDESEGVYFESRLFWRFSDPQSSDNLPIGGCALEGVAVLPLTKACSPGCDVRVGLRLWGDGAPDVVPAVSVFSESCSVGNQAVPAVRLDYPSWTPTPALRSWESHTPRLVGGSGDTYEFGAVRYDVVDGVLPPGLQLDTGTGVISGAVSEIGHPGTVTVQASISTDQIGGQSHVATVVLTIGGIVLGLGASGEHGTRLQEAFSMLQQVVEGGAGALAIDLVEEVLRLPSDTIAVASELPVSQLLADVVNRTHTGDRSESGDLSEDGRSDGYNDALETSALDEASGREYLMSPRMSAPAVASLGDDGPVKISRKMRSSMTARSMRSIEEVGSEVAHTWTEPGKGRMASRTRQWSKQSPSCRPDTPDTKPLSTIQSDGHNSEMQPHESFVHRASLKNINEFAWIGRDFNVSLSYPDLPPLLSSFTDVDFAPQLSVFSRTSQVCDASQEDALLESLLPRLQFDMQPSPPASVCIDSFTGKITGSPLAEAMGCQYTVTAHWLDNEGVLGGIASWCAVAFAVVSPELAAACNRAYLWQMPPAFRLPQHQRSAASRSASEESRAREAAESATGFVEFESVTSTTRSPEAVESRTGSAAGAVSVASARSPGSRAASGACALPGDTMMSHGHSPCSAMVCGAGAASLASYVKPITSEEMEDWLSSTSWEYSRAVADMVLDDGGYQRQSPRPAPWKTPESRPRSVFGAGSRRQVWPIIGLEAKLRSNVFPLGPSLKDRRRQNGDSATCATPHRVPSRSRDRGGAATSCGIVSPGHSGILPRVRV